MELRQTENKYDDSFEIYCWRRMEKIKWPEKVTTEKFLTFLRWDEKRAKVLDL